MARAISHSPATPQHRQHALTPEQRPRTTASRPEVTGLERLLHDLNISDPELLLQATALDHATRALAAEAITTALNRTTATQEAVHSGYPYSRPARLAAQDSPTAYQDRSSAEPAPSQQSTALSTRGAQQGPVRTATRQARFHRV